MGISGLHGLIKPVICRRNISEYRGKTVAVDAYSWLHKAAYTCPLEIINRKYPVRLLQYFERRLDLLRKYEIRVYLVFDGGELPAKTGTEKLRAKSRRDNLEAAEALTRQNKGDMALELYRKAVDITPDTAYVIIEHCILHKIDFIVAPYEADSQLAYMSMQGIVDLVITEDSDLVPFGAMKIAFKMDDKGYFDEYDQSRLFLPVDEESDINVGGFNLGGIDLSRWNLEKLQIACILSGCDYLPSLKGVGVKTAFAIVSYSRNLSEVIKSLSLKVFVSDEYYDTFKLAILAFKYQRVFDPRTRQIVHLDNSNSITAIKPDESQYIGAYIEKEDAILICEGHINPITRSNYAKFNPQGNSNISTHINRNVSISSIAKRQLPIKLSTAKPRFTPNYFSYIKKTLTPKSAIPVNLLEKTNAVPEIILLDAEDRDTTYVPPLAITYSASIKSLDHYTFHAKRSKISGTATLNLSNDVVDLT